MTNDVPNAFIQAKIPEPGEGEDRIIMKITGVLVDLLIEIAPDVYNGYVVYERGHKVIYVQVLRALYGMLKAALLWYKKFRKDLEDIGFRFNPYDPCVANRMRNRRQHTIRFHVDDLMSSHEDPRVNDDFYEWLNAKYGEHGEVTMKRGKVHDYLGMDFVFTNPGELIVDMTKYMEDMVDSFDGEIKTTDSALMPLANNGFDVDDSEPLDEEARENFHTVVAKGLYACKRGRPDIHAANAHMPSIYEAVLAQGAKPFGMFAMDSLRIEKGYLAYGHDLDTDMNRAKACIGVVPQEINLNTFDRVDNIVINQAGFYGVPQKRARVMFKFKELIEQNMQSLAELLSSEHGKVIDDAKGDVQRGLEVIEYACGIPQALKGEYTQGAGPGIDVYSMRQPLGIGAGITPFNFPAMIPMWMFGMACAAGNAFILKPSERDPSVPVRLAELFLEAGAPEGLLQVVHGDKEMVDAIIDHPDIPAISFVGSSDIAQYSYSRGSANAKRVQAFGGAKNHGIVMPDAGLDQVDHLGFHRRVFG